MMDFCLRETRLTCPGADSDCRETIIYMPPMEHRLHGRVYSKMCEREKEHYTDIPYISIGL